MNFSKIKPLIIEMLGLVISILVLIGLVFTGLIEIKIKMHLFTITLILLLTSLLLYVYSRIIRWGIRALCDFVFQNVTEGEFRVLSESPYRASVFTETRDVHYVPSGPQMYYWVVAEDVNGGKISFISTTFLNFQVGRWYTIKSASKSHVILSTYVESLKAPDQ